MRTKLSYGEFGLLSDKIEQIYTSTAPYPTNDRTYPCNFRHCHSQANGADIIEEQASEKESAEGAELNTIPVPHKLKYRLFAASVCHPAPFGILNLYNYQRIETLVQEKISQQSHSQLEQMYRTLEDQLSVAFKTLIFLEQDSTVASVLTHPGRAGTREQNLMEEKFKNLNNSFFLYNPSVYFTILDFHGNAYTSYSPRRPSITESRGTTLALIGNRWRACRIIGFRAIRTTCRDISTSPYLLSLYAYMETPATSRTAWPGSASITPSGFNRY